MHEAAVPGKRKPAAPRAGSMLTELSCCSLGGALALLAAFDLKLQLELRNMEVCSSAAAVVPCCSCCPAEHRASGSLPAGVYIWRSLPCKQGESALKAVCKCGVMSSD